MMFWAYIFQTIILNLGYALSPLLIGFMALPALKHIGNRYLLNLVGVLLWPLGWAVAALITQGILDFMTDPVVPVHSIHRPTLYSLQNLRSAWWWPASGNRVQHGGRAAHHPARHFPAANRPGANYCRR